MKKMDEWKPMEDSNFVKKEDINELSEDDDQPKI